MKPYAKAQTILYVGLQDKRRKITDTQRKEIVRMHEEEQLGYRAIAKRFGVSRSLVRLICDPEAARKNSERQRNNWRRYYKLYGKEAHASAIRDYRNRKYKLYMAGELAEKPQTQTEGEPK